MSLFSVGLSFCLESLLGTSSTITSTSLFQAPYHFPIFQLPDSTLPPYTVCSPSSNQSDPFWVKITSPLCWKSCHGSPSQGLTNYEGTWGSFEEAIEQLFCILIVAGLTWLCICQNPFNCTLKRIILPDVNYTSINLTLKKKKAS